MRRKDREITRQAELDELIESCDCMRLGLYSEEDGVYIVPLSFGYQAGAPAKFYMHGAKEGRKIRLIGSGGKAGFELDCAHRLGEAETGCGHTYYYRSVIGTGHIAQVADPEEKKRALALIMAHYRKDRAFSFTDEQADSVAVFCLTVEKMTGKEHI